MRTLDILRCPEVISVEKEDGWAELCKTEGFCETGQAISGRAVSEAAERYSDGEGDVAAELSLRSESMEVFLTAKKGAVRHVLLQWKEPFVTVEEMSSGADGIRLYGDHWERGYGDLAWRGICPDREMPWYFLINDGSRTDGYGVMAGPAALCSWFADGDYVSLLLDVRCGATGVRLGGRTIKAAEITRRTGLPSESPFEAARAFCGKLCPAPRLPKQPVYGGNNWYYAYGNCCEADFLEDCRLMARLSEGISNRPFMVLDDGWQAGKEGGGAAGIDAWASHPEKFPDMKAMTEKIHAMGVRPGIWYRPLAGLGDIPQEWLLPERKGGAGKDKSLDPSVPEVLEKIKNDVRRFANWGFELLKHDFTTWDCFQKWGVQMHSGAKEEEWSFRDQTKTTAEIYLALYRAIREGAGDMLVIGCNTWSHLAAGLFELQRTGDDTSGFQWERTRKMGINTLALRIHQHNIFYAADADCVGITDSVDWEKNRQWLDLLAKSHTPLFVSISPKNIDEERAEAVRKAFVTAAADEAPAEPLDWLYNKTPVLWKTRDGVMRYHWTQTGSVELCDGYVPG